eukprot:CAMPEP_0117045932 /NCGR_PEP_ID=MMETSP0472-20121206/31773_1 /TAXON_ID=693140 ORGANISM="Tiarina fusus, Strain LIS" /NCGR_SAMPLE_ID=MMETSP0472 /ASSEMBLY_ACC=CAM_ASM_000603 /LENGTH=53 /DNA_ID=CAMNT_0004758117 /DNA_START=15 /DNA_END=176 /DNA_ORIENTATION=+
MLLQMLYKATFFSSNGESQIGPVLDMPDNTAAGTLYNPPDTESCCGMSFDGSD